MSKLFTFASALALAAGITVSAAEAGGRGTVQIGAGNAANFGNVSGRVHINQNGNGCRNRCYGTQTFNAGWNNGNTNTISIGKGHGNGYMKGTW